MIIEEKSKEKITISFSGKVGKQGLNKIKSFVEFLEKGKELTKIKAPSSVLNSLAEEVNEAAWKKLKKAKKLQ